MNRSFVSYNFGQGERERESTVLLREREREREVPEVIELASYTTSALLYPRSLAIRSYRAIVLRVGI